ncbi:PrsW family intramembrane metalloprotease [Sesbania bispinosa]|nr:PrsW family intramembrane metalloprotease [Sesbania bispinosa]
MANLGIQEEETPGDRDKESSPQTKRAQKHRDTHKTKNTTYHVIPHPEKAKTIKRRNDQ